MTTPPSRDPYTLSSLRLGRDAATPLYRQIVELLRRDILEGTISSGQRLASTRVLSQDLSVSRNTVVEAIDQLTAEGYLSSRVGSGTFVAEDLPEDLLRFTGPPTAPLPRKVPPLSRRGSRLRDGAPAGLQRGQPFQLGRPALDLFPRATWGRLLARRARNLRCDSLDYSDAAGFLPLRERLARHVGSTRGLVCSAEQILVVRGSQQGLDLAARVLLDEQDEVWIEDPGYPSARAAFAAAGAREVSVPIDDEGLDVEAGRHLAPEARMAYVTPSHQYPLGITMSLPRRLDLLDWARGAGAWVIEDDYDSEYRFHGRPLASLAGLDGGRNVLYLGTFSKVLFPGLRLGYLVVPREHVDAFVAAREASDRCSGLLEQAVLHDFFDEGHFDRHVRKMRRIYADRQEALGRAVAEHLSGRLELQSSPAGLHDVGWLRGRLDDRRIADQALEVGVQVGALSRYCHKARLSPALLLGYSGFPAEELEAAVGRLAGVLPGGT